MIKITHHTSLLALLLSLAALSQPCTITAKSSKESKKKIETISDEDLGTEYHDIAQLMRAAQAEAQLAIDEAKRKGAEVKSLAERKKQRIAQREALIRQREEAQKAALDEDATARARELERAAKRKAAEVIENAKKQAVALKKTLAETDQLDRARKPEITSTWRERILRECKADLTFMKNIITEGEMISNERKQFVSLLDGQLTWFTEKVKESKHFFDDIYRSIIKKKNRLSLLVDAQRQADVEIYALSQEYTFSEEVTARLRTITLYELNHFLTEQGEGNETEIARDDITRMVRDSLTVLVPEHKKIKITTEGEKITALEERIAELEEIVAAKDERVDAERAEQRKLNRELLKAQREKEKLEREYDARIDATVAKKVDILVAPVREHNAVLSTELKRAQIVRDLLQARTERDEKAWKTAQQEQMLVVREYRQGLKAKRRELEALKKKYKTIQRELDMLASQSQEEIIAKAQEASKYKITTAHLEKVIADKKQEKGVLEGQLETTKKELSALNDTYKKASDSAETERASTVKERALMRQQIAEKDARVKELQEALGMKEQALAASSDLHIRREATQHVEKLAQLLDESKAVQPVPVPPIPAPFDLTEVPQYSDEALVPGLVEGTKPEKREEEKEEIEHEIEDDAAPEEGEGGETIPAPSGGTLPDEEKKRRARGEGLIPNPPIL